MPDRLAAVHWRNRIELAVLGLEVLHAPKLGTVVAAYFVRQLKNVARLTP